MRLRCLEITLWMKYRTDVYAEMDSVASNAGDIDKDGIVTEAEIGAYRAKFGVPIEGISANVGDNEEDFVIVTESGGLSRVVEGATGTDIGWAYGSSLADFDGDGWLDVYSTAGFKSARAAAFLTTSAMSSR